MPLDYQPPPAPPDREPPNWWILILALAIGALLFGAPLLFYILRGKR